MPVKPFVQVGLADAANLAGDSDKWKSAPCPPVADCTGFDSADISGGGVIVEKFDAL